MQGRTVCSLLGWLISPDLWWKRPTLYHKIRVMSWKRKTPLTVVGVGWGEQIKQQELRDARPTSQPSPRQMQQGGVPLKQLRNFWKAICESRLQQTRETVTETIICDENLTKKYAAERLEIWPEQGLWWYFWIWLLLKWHTTALRWHSV